jgi:predicted nucleotidyltransferase
VPPLACSAVAPENARVLAERPLPPDLPERLSALAEAWRSEADLAALYLFGSLARGTAGLRSDVDLAVILRRDLDAGGRWRKRLELIGRASDLLGTDAVDVVVLEDAPSALGHRVLRDGRLLCERDSARRTAVAEDVMRRYLDEAYLRSELDRALAERVREDRFAR